MFYYDDNGASYIEARGVTLNREPMGEKLLWTTLFLEDIGIISVSSKNFMGSSEPFSWGIFSLKIRGKTQKYFLEDIDIKDDMLGIQWGFHPLKTAFDWAKRLVKTLRPKLPDNELLTNFYWSLKLLAVRYVPVEAVDWRFMWLWLEEWGIAPDLFDFHKKLKFNDAEIKLLMQLSFLNYDGVVNLFKGRLDGEIRENALKIAAKYAAQLLEKNNH